jgi:phosphoglycolate phosphatase
MDVTIAAAHDSPGGRLPSVLFDLDGTLVDPAGGITGGIAHALAAVGLPVPGDDALSAMIGPKLADALVSIAGVPQERVPEVIDAYRGWYASTGMDMSRVYPGVRELLAGLRAGGHRLAVATQKPEPLANRLLAHHGIDTCFDVIRGSHADEMLMPGEPGYRADKSEIIASALADISPLAAPCGAPNTGPGTVPEAVMVGDRHQDVNGARSNGLDCIGVSWGFAPDGELAAAGAAAVVQTAAELGQLLGLYAGRDAAREAVHGAV